MPELKISVGDTIQDNDARRIKPGEPLRTGTVAAVQPGHVTVEWKTGKRTDIIRASIYPDDKPRKGKYTLVDKTGAT